MIYISDLQQLVSLWIDRMGNPAQPFDYRTAVNECINDLNNLIEKTMTEELDYEDMLQSWEADNYLSSMEAHEQAA